MDLVAGAVGSVIGKLGELLQAEYKLQKGLPQQIESLKHELESAQTALSKVGEVRPEQLDPQVRLWASEVREASYDMEDILDTCLVSILDVDAPADNKSGLLKRLLKNIADFLKKSKPRHTIAGAIEDMKKRLQEVADRRNRFSVAVALPSPATKPDPRLADMHKEAKQLIGIDNPRAELIAMLLPDLKNKKRKAMLLPAFGDSDVSGGSRSSRKMKIVSVVGVGGLGKTTLAKAVYDELQSQYDCGAFLSIGREPDLAQVLINILQHLDINKYTAIHNLSTTFTNWRLQREHPFVNNDTGSIVITTTRNRDVASREEVYELCTLSPYHSEKLFKTRLFGVNGEYPANHPAEASENILKKCGGIPLAIITMASLLVGKSREDWFDVCNSPGFYRGNKGNQQVDDTEWILSLSYYDMPSYLRTCLLYLSVYPEDYEIDKHSLIWKWIAEGFVEKRRGTSLFQQGEEYFNQLINRSMIQAVEPSDDSREIEVCGCRVHDMVLDLIRDLSYKENFVTISNDGEGTSPHQNRVRRLAHQNRIMKQTQQDDHTDMAHVRSLVACDCDIENLVLHPSYKLLRVLDLEGCTVPSEVWQGLKHLGNLLHLRYLGLRSTRGCYELPQEIGKLKFLQTLDLEDSEIVVLPSCVCQLTQLVFLRGDFRTCAPDGSFLRKVTSLEYLSIRIYNLAKESQRQFMKDVGNLSEVRVLCIRGSWEGMVQLDLVHSLGNLHKLQHLELREDLNSNGEAATREWDRVVLPWHLRHLDLDPILFRQLPSYISPAHLPILGYLCLRVDHMDEAGLRALGALPELRFLELSTPRPSMACTATVANINTAPDGFFKKLRCCLLHGWMVQLVLNEDSNGVSFSILKGMGVVAFGSKTKDEYSRSIAPPPVMPNLQELWFDVLARALYKDGNRTCGDLGLKCLPSLRTIQIDVNCDGASTNDVEKAESELRNAAQLHPNGPRIELELFNQWTDQDDTESDDGDNVSAKEE
uniref:NB-ARC domain-containing protein n=1 Tax=Setaria italica TaxID=4555 RepID=K3ZH48_SETIT